MISAGDEKSNGIGEFALAFRARRSILQTLFYATRNSSLDAWAFHQRVEKSTHSEHPLAALVSGFLHSFDKTIAEQTAQDAAWAFVLIADYALQRLADSVEPLDTRELGPTLAHGVRLSAAVWALANQARHLHKWMNEAPDVLARNPSVVIIRSLQHDPLNPNAAREVLAALPYPAYVDFEDAISEIANEAAVAANSEG